MIPRFDDETTFQLAPAVEDATCVHTVTDLP
jgi:hypothetical protein